jgi:hypothetical protein
MVAEEAGKSTPPDGMTVALWTALVGGPLVVLFDQWVGYALLPDACARQNSLFVHLVHLVALLLLAAGFLLCRREWARLGEVEPDEGPGPDHRARFMAYSGMLALPFMALIVLAMWLATVLFSPCSG